MDALPGSYVVARISGTLIFAMVALIACLYPGYFVTASEEATNSSRQATVSLNSPLLPPQLTLEEFLPDLSLNPQFPSIVPEDFTALYTAADWQDYQKQFGNVTSGLVSASADERAAVAEQLLTASVQAGSIGLGRLLAIRTFALTYDSSFSSPLAQQSLERYMQLVIDVNNPVQIAPIWTMSHLLASVHATPLQNRQQYAVLAERANVQLTIDFLNAGQLDAANRVVSMLGIHETRAVRANAPLMAEMDIARTLVVQTRQMIEYLDLEYVKVQQGNPDASVPVYLYARFIRDWPQMRSAIMRLWPTGMAAVLDDALEAGTVNTDDAYLAGKLLKEAATTLPAGILRDRTMYAALTNYRVFMNDPATQNERINRTLAHVAVQQLYQQGARPQPVVNTLVGLIGPVSTGQPEATQRTASAQRP